MTNKEQNNLSKYIALILRHRPDVIGITLDEHGWANVSDLLKGINKTQTITMKMLEKIVEEDSKQRYSFNREKTLIRANQGHSIKVDVELKECKSELQKEHSLVSNNNDVIIVFDINSLVTIKGNVQFSFEDANKENFVEEVELNMKGIVNTQISVNKSTMEISSVYSDEPDLFDVINKALLRK